MSEHDMTGGTCTKNDIVWVLDGDADIAGRSAAGAARWPVCRGCCNLPGVKPGGVVLAGDESRDGGNEAREQEGRDEHRNWR